jgi:hypothetical protein
MWGIFAFLIREVADGLWLWEAHTPDGWREYGEADTQRDAETRAIAACGLWALTKGLPIH